MNIYFNWLQFVFLKNMLLIKKIFFLSKKREKGMHE
jgi:hypothetical protein